TISGQPHMTEACSDELVIITVARISPEKNTLGAIRFLQGIDPGTCRITWHLYGTHTDPDYYRQCKEAASGIPINVQFHGEIEHSAIRGVLERGHVMYMPTLGENYGHSIVEAFVSGTPVLISDKTPWIDLESKKAGWDISLDSAGFGKIIEQLVTMSPEEYSEFCHGAFNLGKQIANNPDHLEQNYRLFEHE
ncbi:MAG: glycosyltransferase family 4 protein, partial [Flavobacteriales bacterium]|nr:glycosyltransferase family 4 protein [Flavobacteriales bacterium]